MSLKAQFVLLLCVAMDPAAVIGILEAISAFQRQSQKIEESLLQSATIAAAADRQIIATARTLLHAFVAQDAVVSGQQPACDQALARAIAQAPDYVRLMRLDSKGNVLCTSNRQPQAGPFGDRGWFQDAMAGSDFAVSSVIAAGRGRAAVVTAIPMRAGEQVTGVLAVSIGQDTLMRRAQETVGMLKPLSILIDENGRPVTEGDPAPLAEKLPPVDLLKGSIPAAGRAVEARGGDGVKRLYAMISVVPGRLAVVTSQPLATTAAVNMNLWIAVGIPLVIWLLAIITMWIGLERLVLRWLSYLRRVGAGYARGHYVVMPRYAEQAPTEFEQLARTLSQMALTARARQRDLRAALEQKNVLVREIHHRVKNNLQIIQSLLNLQSRSATDSNQFTALAAAKSRINALALVHQSLYEDETLQYVNLHTLLDELCRHLLQSGWGAAKRVGINVDAPEIMASPDQAVPIALLVTEAVTNGLKHAFFGRDNGAITVTLVNDLATGAALTIRDNGIGMETGPRPKVKPAAGGGIGYSLIEGFARQLRRTVETIVEDGTCVSVKFPYLTGRKTA